MLQYLLKHRIPILIIGIISTILMGFNMIYLSIDGSFSSVLPKNDSDFLYNRYVEQTFGNSDELIILVKDKRTIYSERSLRLIKELSRELSLIEAVDESRIFSILTASGHNKGDLKEFIDKDPFIADFLVGEEDRSTLIVAPVSNEIALSDVALRELADKTISLVDRYREKYPEIQLYVTGHPIVNAEIVKKMANDLFLLFPVAIVAVALMLLYILRSFRGMMIPLTITFASIAWTLGLKGLLRSNLTITETVIPVILISIACADGIHMVSETFHYMHRGLSSRKAVIRAVSNLWKPIVLTSITTAIGFASFIFSPGESLRNMGLFLAFGVIMAMIFSLLYIPILLSFYKPLRAHGDRKHYARQYHILRIITAFTRIIIQKRIPVLIFTVLLLGLSLWGILHINTDTDEVRYFKKDNSIRQSAEVIEKELGGISVIQIVLESETPDRFKDLVILENMGKLQEFLNARPEVSQTISIVDYISYLYYRIRGNRPEFFEIPGNQLFLYRMLKLVESSDDPQSKNIYAFVDEEFRRVKISVRLTDSNTRAIERLVHDIKPQLETLFDDSIKIGYAGDYLRLRN
ncbi:MAG: MMPL family transporter, partial [Spirochaetaceae bacterium]|nr:MMPL family transporter [Spirochaetaceae bacterium]